MAEPTQSPPRPPKLETLLTASAATFAARGYSGTSMRDIAHDSGISLSGIYYYTRGKASLLYEIQARTIDALLASAAEALASVTRPVEQLLRFIENHISYMDEHPSFVRVLTHETAPESNDERRGVIDLKRHEYVRVLRDILDRAARGVAGTRADAIRCGHAVRDDERAKAVGSERYRAQRRRGEPA